MDRALLRHLAHLSTIATALLAIGGLLVAVWQIRASEASQREASARDAYKEYLKLVIEKPELAEPDLPGSTSGPAREAGQDNLFSFYLFSAEQIFDAFPDDPGWHQSLQHQDQCEPDRAGQKSERRFRHDHGSPFGLSRTYTLASDSR